MGNVEILVNCVIGQMRSLESKCKTFQLSLRWKTFYKDSFPHFLVFGSIKKY